MILRQILFMVVVILMIIILTMLWQAAMDRAGEVLNEETRAAAAHKVQSAIQAITINNIIL